MRQRGALWAGLLALGLTAGSSAARADTVWLKPQGVEGLAQALARVGAEAYRREDAKPGDLLQVCVRGRIVGLDKFGEVHPQPKALIFRPWFRAGPGVGWGRDPGVPGPEAGTIEIPLKWVATIEHEVDHPIDFAFMLGNHAPPARYKLGLVDDPANKAWNRALNATIDPRGEFDLSVDASSSPQPAPPTDVVGWVTFALADPSTAGVPASPASPDESPEAYRARVAAEDARLRAALRSGAIQPTPDGRSYDWTQSLGTSPEAVVHDLLEGLAIYEKYFADLPDPDGLRDRSPGHRQDFVRQARSVLAFLCRLAKVQPNSPAKARLHEFGRRAREGVYQALESAAAGRLHTSDLNQLDVRTRLPAELARARTRLPEEVAETLRARYAVLDTENPAAIPRYPSHVPPKARLLVSPTDVALQALELIRLEPSWYVLHERDLEMATREADRLVTDLCDLRLELGPPGQAWPDPRRYDASRGEIEPEARGTLLLLLRKDTADLVPDPSSPSGQRMVAARDRAKPLLKDALASLSVVPDDEGRRRAAELALMESAATRDVMATQRTVESLLSVAAGETIPDLPEEASDEEAPEEGGAGANNPWAGVQDDEDGELGGEKARRRRRDRQEAGLRRAARKHAVTALVVLASLYGSQDADENRVGELVVGTFDRLQRRVADGSATVGEVKLIRLLGRLSTTPEEGAVSTYAERLPRRMKDYRERHPD